jgi:hypothetical protein
MSEWGERDTSLGRWGTRLARLATQRVWLEVAAVLDEVSGPSDASVDRRMAAAWDVERHVWSFRSRRQAGERVTRAQAARDALRSESLRKLLTLEAPPYSE